MTWNVLRQFQMTNIIIDKRSTMFKDQYSVIKHVPNLNIRYKIHHKFIQTLSCFSFSRKFSKEILKKCFFYNNFQNFDSHQTNEDSLPCMYYNTFFTRHFHVVIRSYWIVILHFSWSISMTFLLLKVYRWNIHVYNHKIISRLILIFRNLPKTFPLPEKCLK